MRPREQRLALIAAGVIGCWVATRWVLQPLWGHVVDLRLHVESQTERFDALSRLVAQAPSIERAYEALTPYFETQPDEDTQRAFLSELERMARSAGIQLNLKPRPLQQTEHGSAFEVEVDVEGAQRACLSFVDAVLGMPAFMTIDRLRLLTVPAQTGTVRVNLVVQRLLVRT